MIAKIVGIGAALTLSAWLYVLTWQMAELLNLAEHLIAGHTPPRRLTEPVEPDPLPATQPDGIAVQVQGALLRPTPAPVPTVSRELGGRTFQFRTDEEMP